MVNICFGYSWIRDSYDYFSAACTAVSIGSVRLFRRIFLWRKAVKRIPIRMRSITRLKDKIGVHEQSLPQNGLFKTVGRF